MFIWKEPEYHIVTTEEQLRELCSKLQSSIDNKKPVAVDTESTGAYNTAGLNPYLDWLLGMSFAFGVDEGYYIPIAHTRNGELRPNQLSLDTIRQHLAPILSSGGVYIGHNFKHDYRFLLQAGIDIFPCFWDTMIAQQLLHGGLRESSKLKEIISDYLIIPAHLVRTFDDVTGGSTAAEIDPVEFMTYAINDSIFTYYVYMALKPQIDSIYPILFYNAEMPLTAILAQMELRGIRIDKDYFGRISTPLRKCRDKIEKYFKEEYNTNLASPIQVGKMLSTYFGEVELERSKKTESIVTGVKAIQNITNKYKDNKPLYKVAKHLLVHRRINKALTTYIEKFPEICCINYSGGKEEHILHTSFKQVVNTGRMSSSPNVQNITRDDALVSIRSGFTARDGFEIVEADWSGQELRIGAVATKDPTMVAMYLANPREADLHTKTAQGIYEKDIVSKFERYIGKKINFSIFYGATPHRIASELNCSKEQAAMYIDGFYSTYPGVLSWKKEVEDFILSKGYSETLFGRRRYITKDMLQCRNDRYNKWRYEGAIRELTNHIIQGTSADIMKLTLPKIVSAFAKHEMTNTHIITSVHDSITTETTEAKRVADMMKSIMEITIDRILFPVDVEIKKTFSKAA